MKFIELPNAEIQDPGGFRAQNSHKFSYQTLRQLKILIILAPPLKVQDSKIIPFIAGLENSDHQENK